VARRRSARLPSASSDRPAGASSSAATTSGRSATAKSDADITWKDIRTSLRIIHQDPGASLNPNRRILSILSEPLNQVNAELSRSEKRERIYPRCSERVGMNPAADFAERYPHQLLGGEKQRVALSRALLMNPDVILADRAISALDVSLRVEMMDLMHELQNEFNTSFVFISPRPLERAVLHRTRRRANRRHVPGRTGGDRSGRGHDLGPTSPLHQRVCAGRRRTSLAQGRPATRRCERSTSRTRSTHRAAAGSTRGARRPEKRVSRRHRRTTRPANSASPASARDEDHAYWNSPELTDGNPRRHRTNTDVGDESGLSG